MPVKGGVSYLILWQARRKSMKEVIHFDSQEARLAYLSGKYEEIICESASEEKKAEKKTKKKAKKKEVKDEVPAE